VHAFDLTEGKRHCHTVACPDDIGGVALTEDGAHLFAVCQNAAAVLDTRTGVSTALIAAPQEAQPVGQLFDCAMACVFDDATRSLLVSEFHAHCIVCVPGIKL
jgi:hypothetical protein